MNIDPNRFQNLISAINAERKHEEAFFKSLNESKTIQDKLKSGYVWYPVDIQKKSYSIGEYLEVEILRVKESKSDHKFSEGISASLFNIQDERVDLRCIISSVRNDKIKVLIHADQEEILDDYKKGNTGLEVIYDDRPYKVMEQAIKTIMTSTKPELKLLKNTFTSEKLTEKELRQVEDLNLENRNDLNFSQKEAIKTCLRSPRLGIIHGPPGTGKTTTLVALVESLLKSEKRILVCASSNNAVDLLAERISKKGISVLRVGNITRIDDDLMHLTIEEKVRAHQDWNHIKKVKIQAQDVDKKASQFKRNFGHEERIERRELRKEAKDLRKWAMELEDRIINEIVFGSQVIATTLVGVSNRILREVSFKTLIIDEASQALEPECWNAILKSERVILAGDHKQLPPTVKSADARKFGLENTMLDYMTDKIEHCSLLNIQYRMNNHILGFSNLNFYNNQLISDPIISEGRLRNDQFPLVFIDTAGCGFEEEVHEERRSYKNPGEYFIIREHVIANLEKILGATIGIICPYAEQVKYIRQEIIEDEILKTLDIQVNSIDGFQGQERELIYISLVRSNEIGEIGFLKDERRLNVAMTRAQKKLVILGDSATLAQNELFSSLITHIEAEGNYDSAWNYMSY